MKRQGFTLVELMVVIAVIGILAAIALPRFANITKDAEIAQIQANERNLQTALNMYMVSEDKEVNDLFDLYSEVGKNSPDIVFEPFYKYYRKNELPALPGTDRNKAIVLDNLSDEYIKENMKVIEKLKLGWAFTSNGNVYPLVEKDKYGIGYDEF